MIYGAPPAFVVVLIYGLIVSPIFLHFFFAIIDLIFVRTPPTSTNSKTNKVQLAALAGVVVLAVTLDVYAWNVVKGYNKRELEILEADNLARNRLQQYTASFALDMAMSYRQQVLLGKFDLPTEAEAIRRVLDQGGPTPEKIPEPFRRRDGHRLPMASKLLAEYFKLLDSRDPKIQVAVLDLAIYFAQDAGNTSLVPGVTDSEVVRTATFQADVPSIPGLYEPTDPELPLEFQDRVKSLAKALGIRH